MTKTPFNTHIYTSKTKLPLEVWRASDFYPTLFLDGLEAAVFWGALALERSANSTAMAKEIRLQLGMIWGDDLDVFVAVLGGNFFRFHRFQYVRNVLKWLVRFQPSRVREGESMKIAYE